MASHGPEASSPWPAQVSRAAEPSPWELACRVPGQAAPCRHRAAGPAASHGPPVDGHPRHRSAPPAEPATSATSARCSNEPRWGIQGPGGGRRPPPARERSSPRWYPTVCGPARAHGRRPKAQRFGSRGCRCDSVPGTIAVTGMARRNAAADAARTEGRGVAGAARTPSVPTARPSLSNVATTVPSRSVRRTRAPCVGQSFERHARRVAVRVAGAGRGDGDRGRTVSTDPWVVAVRLPWCATFNRSNPRQAGGEGLWVDLLFDIPPSAGTVACPPARQARPTRC